MLGSLVAGLLVFTSIVLAQRGRTTSAGGVDPEDGVGLHTVRFVVRSRANVLADDELLKNTAAVASITSVQSLSLASQVINTPASCRCKHRGATLFLPGFDNPRLAFLTTINS